MINELIRLSIALAVLAALPWALSVRANAAEAPETNYMATMIAAATVGDADCGHQAEELRNAKIAAQGLSNVAVSWDELYLLAKIIYAEAGSYWLPDEWKMSVGEVVLNRVASPEFPNTMQEVIYQPGQYYGRQSRYFESLRPDERAALAAKRLLEGERVLNDPSVVFQANFKQGSGTAVSLYDKRLGRTYFCYSSRPELYGEGQQ